MDSTNIPITDEAMLRMLANGIAIALGHDKPNYPASLGHGIYERVGNDYYRCISSNWDSSG